MIPIGFLLILLSINFVVLNLRSLRAAAFGNCFFFFLRGELLGLMGAGGNLNFGA